MATGYPFYDQTTQRMVIDALCSCGRKESEHEHGPGDQHGGGCKASGCSQFSMFSYIFEQAKVPREVIDNERLQTYAGQ